MLSIVIPTLNAAATLPATLAALAPWHPRPVEVLVADGGSKDGTATQVESAGVQLVPCARGRGVQLLAGAKAAQGEWLLFLHADTRLEPGWAEVVAGYMADPVNQGRAAHFRFALDDPGPQARRLERMVAWRCRALALPYGDQGLLISRSLYEAVGGFRPLPLMEDVDLVRRLGRKRLFGLEVAAVTSADKWRRDGWWARSARNLACLSLWYAGVPPRIIRRVYG